jgi:DNA repair protein RecN (Recombination protein N)
LLSLQSFEASGAQRREELQQTLEELNALPNLRPGRRAELDGEIKRIGNFERLNQAGQRALDLLTGDEGLGVKLREVSAVLAELRRYDATTGTIINDFEVACDALTRSELAIGRYVHTIDADTSSLENLREELSELARLERKYRTDDAGLCERRERARDELAQLGGGPGLQALEKDVASKLAEFKSLALDLRKVRQKAAKSLMTSVTDALAELNMADARLEVRFGECEASPKGIDRVDFLMSSNKGESHGALSQIASGGELSRVMLVLKKVLREQSGVNVLIFDEVDTGISGGVARSVGRMLKDIGSQSQVICITHLPQVASLSDKHFLVQKEIGDRAVTVVRALTEGEKVDEIARMLAGFTITEASRASARELIESR